MIENSEVVFKIKIDHSKVRKKYEEYQKEPKNSKLLSEQQELLFEALLCSTFIYVPEAQLARFIEYGRVVD